MVNLFEFNSISEVHLSLKVDSHVRRKQKHEQKKKVRVDRADTAQAQVQAQLRRSGSHVLFLVLRLVLMLAMLKKLYECFARLCLDLLVVYRSVYLNTLLSLCQCLFVFSLFFHAKTDKTRKYSYDTKMAANGY